VIVQRTAVAVRALVLVIILGNAKPTVVAHLRGTIVAIVGRATRVVFRLLDPFLGATVRRVVALFSELRIDNPIAVDRDGAVVVTGVVVFEVAVVTWFRREDAVAAAGTWSNQRRILRERRADVGKGRRQLWLRNATSAARTIAESVRAPTLSAIRALVIGLQRGAIEDLKTSSILDRIRCLLFGDGVGASIEIAGKGYIACRADRDAPRRSCRAGAC
jgi:hypothetical protein